jgi:hypothetical protein
MLDNSGTLDEIVAQKRFIAQLAHEINVSPRGSRLGVVDSQTGIILISPNTTDSRSILACNVVALPNQMKSTDLPRVLNSLKTELEKLRSEEERLNYESDLGIMFLVLVQGKKLEENQKSEIRRLIDEMSLKYGDVKILFTSSKYQQNDFEGFVPDTQRNFIRIQSGQNLSDFADEFANEIRGKAAQGRLSYTKCNSNKFNQDEEHKVEQTFYVTPDTIDYRQISPDYFYSARNLRLRFTSFNGKVRVCQSRDEPMPNSRNGAHCQDTSGSYVPPGSSQKDVEFMFEKPCGKHGNRNGCKPIYVSFTPTEFNNLPGHGGLDCRNEPCHSPNQVRVTFTHWDMRCNGTSKVFTSIPGMMAALLLSLLVWKRSM